MSYCRWSSDNFKCDVYVYADVYGGWRIHVAANRIVGEIPDDRFEDFINNKISAEEFASLHNAQMEYLKTVVREQIKLPYAGESFDDATPGECADRLEYLRGLGYTVPQYAIDELRQDEVENAKA